MLSRARACGDPECAAQLRALSRNAEALATAPDDAMEHARCLLAAGRAAQAGLRLHAAPGEDAAALRVNAALRAQAPERALDLADAALAAHPGSAPIMARRAAALVALGRAQHAADWLDAASPALRGAPSWRRARAEAALALGDLPRAGAEADALLARDPLDPGAIALRLGAASRAAEAEQVAQQLRAAIADAPAPARLRALAEIAFHAGDWPRAEAAAAALARAQPRDARPLLIGAKAAFAAGRCAEARAAVEAYLTLDPGHAGAAALRLDVLLASGAPRLALGAGLRAVRRGAAPPEAAAQTARDLHALGRHRLARLCIARARVGVEGPAAQMLDYEAELAAPGGWRMRPTAAPEPQTSAAQTGAEGLRTLFAPRPALVQGGALHPAAVLAWTQAGADAGPFGPWRARAMQATRAFAALSTRPVAPDALAPWLGPVNLDALAPYIAGGGAYLLASSHSGPLVLGAVLERLGPITYVAQRGVNWRQAPSAGGRIAPYSGDGGAVAAALHRALRRGEGAMATPDLPASLARRRAGGGVARGRLFGREVALLDTLPRLSQALDAPSFWIEARWRDGRIAVTAAPLPRARADEPADAWPDRWAQAYLDRLACLMTAGPENQNLDAALWRHLLLLGAGGALSRASAGACAKIRA